MTEQQRIRHLQRAWAEEKGLRFDSEGYLPDVSANLREPLSSSARADLSRGAGAELARNMRALHSSSALVANFFDFWTNRNKGPLLAALEIEEKTAESLRFERRFPTGLRGTPPHLDVTLTIASNLVIAIESKFTEHLSLTSRDRGDFAAAYFPPGRRLWDNVQLPKCQEMAEALQDRQIAYHALDVCQLLKHALGLATVLGDQFSLYYLYYDCPGPRSEQHRKEIQSFASLVGKEVLLRPMTYQEVYARLMELRTTDTEYVDYLEYLGSRYFAEEMKK